MSNKHYDMIVGTGAGDGVLAHRVAQSGKNIGTRARGMFLPAPPFMLMVDCCETIKSSKQFAPHMMHW